MVWVEYALFPLGTHFLHIGEKVEEAIVWVWTQWKGVTKDGSVPVA
jgi:hypothetical protein